MNRDELCYTPACELVNLIRSKAVSPLEVMTATIERAREFNPYLNAICTPTYEAAMGRAREAEAEVMHALDKLVVANASMRSCCVATVCDGKRSNL